LTESSQFGYMTIVSGNEFKKLRALAGYSQVTLAKAMDVSLRSVGRLENSKTVPKVMEFALRWIIDQKRKGTR
jgi:DNA-binding XRE family transcriptional regulator